MAKKKVLEAENSMPGRSEEEESSWLWRRLAETKLGSIIGSSDEGERLAIKTLNLPKEIASGILNQFDRTKGDIVNMFAREFKHFLEATDVSEEIVKALSEMTVEIKAEVHFKRKDGKSPSDGSNISLRVSKRS